MLLVPSRGKPRWARTTKIATATENERRVLSDSAMALLTPLAVKSGRLCVAEDDNDDAGGGGDGGAF